MFISLKRYIDSRPEQVSSALLRMVRLLLQGIELHAVKGDAVDYEKFRSDMRKVQENLGDKPVASEVLVLAGATVKSLEEYNSRTSRFLHVQTNELQTMIAMLTKTMTAIASGSETSVNRLQDVEKQLHKAQVIEEIQTLKLRLSECLESVSSEMARQRDEADRRVVELKQAIETAKERTAEVTSAPINRDRVTGLPEREEAEAALRAAIAENKRAFAVVFVIERLDLINARFGHSVGNQLLVFYAQHLQQGLARADRLFRWSGPALVAIIERADLAQAREDVTKLTARRLSKTVKVETRNVLLAVGANWAVFPAAELRPFSAAVQHIDAFVHGPQEARASA